jgi:hypothetical protein
MKKQKKRKKSTVRRPKNLDLFYVEAEAYQSDEPNAPREVILQTYTDSSLTESRYLRDLSVWLLKAADWMEAKK